MLKTIDRSRYILFVSFISFFRSSSSRVLSAAARRSHDTKIELIRQRRTRTSTQNSDNEKYNSHTNRLFGEEKQDEENPEESFPSTEEKRIHWTESRFSCWLFCAALCESDSSSSATAAVLLSAQSLRQIQSIFIFLYLAFPASASRRCCLPSRMMLSFLYWNSKTIIHFSLSLLYLCFFTISFASATRSVLDR